MFCNKIAPGDNNAWRKNEKWTKVNTEHKINNQDQNETSEISWSKNNLQILQAIYSSFTVH